MFLVLLLEISNTILREFIALVAINNHDAAIGTVFCFCFLGCVLLGLSPIGLCFSKPKLTFPSVSAWLVHLAAMVLYFYGDNIGYILQRYGDELGCGDKCIENNRIAAVVLLGSALILLHIMPPLLKDLATLVTEDSEEQIGGWYYALDMIAMLVRIDTVFTVIAIMAQTTEFCSLTDRSLGWSFFVICTIIGVAAIIISSIYAAYKIDQKKSVENAPAMSGIMISAVILLSISLPLYILSDNQQPIDCVWGCDSYATDNTTMIVAADMGISCNMNANSGMRLGFMSLTGILVLVSLGLLGCDWRIEHVV